MRRIAVVLVLMSVAMMAAAQIGGWGVGGGSIGIMKSGGGGGVDLSATVSGSGEYPLVRVGVDIGQPVKLRVSVAFDGKNMDSSADVDSTNVLAVGEAADSWSFSYEFDGTRAFAGDVVTIYAWIYDDDGNDVLFSEDVTISTPETVGHLVVIPVGMDTTNCTSNVLATYLDHAPTIKTMGDDYGGGGDVECAYTAICDTGVVWSNTHLAYGAFDSDYDISDGESDYDAYRLLLWCPLDELLPAGARVLDARFNVVAENAVYQATRDSLVAVLMTNPGDSLWYSSRGVAYDDDYAHASWDYQIHGEDVGGVPDQDPGYPATSSGAWEPSIDERDEIWDWGSVFQSTSETKVHGTYASPRWATDDWYGWNITSLVQAMVDGETNNGMLLLMYCGAGAIIYERFDGPHTASASDHRMPFFTITYTTSGDSPMPDGPDGTPAPLIATFSSDDIVASCNDNWTDVFSGLGLSYTINALKTSVDGTGYASAADLISWRSDGMEIANHGYDVENPDYAVTVFDTAGCYQARTAGTGVPANCDSVPDTDGAFDDLMYELDPCWIYEFMGSSYENDPYVGRTHAINLGSTTIPSIFAANIFGMKAVRTASVGWASVDTTGAFYTGSITALPTECAGGATAIYGDTLSVFAQKSNPLRPWNNLGVSITCRSNDMVGAWDDTLGNQITEAQIRKHVRRVVLQHIQRGVPVMSWFAHDEKDKGYEDQNGITAAEMAIVLDELQDLNVAIKPAYDVAMWRLGLTIPAATPGDRARTNSGWDSWEGEGVWRQSRWLPAMQMYGRNWTGRL